jgi:hypothetical protein
VPSGDSNALRAGRVARTNCFAPNGKMETAHWCRGSSATTTTQAYLQRTPIFFFFLSQHHMPFSRAKLTKIRNLERKKEFIIECNATLGTASYLKNSINNILFDMDKTIDFTNK